MSWQLWVAVGVVAAALLVFVTLRMRHAQHVFHDITRIEPPARADELAHRRAGQTSPEQQQQPGRHRRHG